MGHNAAEDGAPTLAQQAHRAREAQKEAAAAHPVVEELLKAFPGATIEAVRGMAVPAGDAGAAGDDDASVSPDEVEES